MSFRAPRRVCFDGNEGMIRPRLHPPRPGVRINNNPLVWSSVSYPSGDRVDSFSSTFRRRRNMGELDRRYGIGFMRLATVQCNAEHQQQPSLQENWDQQSQLHVTSPRLPDVRGKRHPAAECLDRNLTALSPCVPSTRSDRWLFEVTQYD